MALSILYVKFLKAIDYATWLLFKGFDESDSWYNYRCFGDY